MLDLTDARHHGKTVERIVAGRNGEKFVVRVSARGVFVRPYRARTGEVFAAWCSIYRRQAVADAEDARRQDRGPRRRVKRGILALRGDR